MKKFYIDDCPKDQCVHFWISKSLNMEKYINSIKPKNDGVIFKFKDDLLDLKKLKNDSEKIYEKYGWYGFLNVLSEKFVRGIRYGGLSLVYNPNYIDKNIPVNAQTMGYPKINIVDDLFYNNLDIFQKLIDKRLDKEVWSWTSLGSHELYKRLYHNEIIDKNQFNNLLKNPNTKNTFLIKDTYSDSWSFNQWTEPAKYGYFDNIIKRIKRTPVRSRIAQIRNVNNKDNVKSLNKYMWHRDDSWFYELRLNLSIDTNNDECGLEIENFGVTPFVSGYWYAWDTDFKHRPVVTKPIKKRTNYVLAVNPWFDWDNENKCWIQNEFFGEKHPLDMIIDGDVIEGLTLN